MALMSVIFLLLIYLSLMISFLTMMLPFAVQRTLVFWFTILMTTLFDTLATMRFPPLSPCSWNIGVRHFQNYGYCVNYWKWVTLRLGQLVPSPWKWKARPRLAILLHLHKDGSGDCNDEDVMVGHRCLKIEHF